MSERNSDFQGEFRPSLCPVGPLPTDQDKDQHLQDVLDMFSTFGIRPSVYLS